MCSTDISYTVSDCRVPASRWALRVRSFTGTACGALRALGCLERETPGSERPGNKVRICPVGTRACTLERPAGTASALRIGPRRMGFLGRPGTQGWGGGSSGAVVFASSERGCPERRSKGRRIQLEARIELRFLNSSFSSSNYSIRVVQACLLFPKLDKQFCFEHLRAFRAL